MFKKIIIKKLHNCLNEKNFNNDRIFSYFLNISIILILLLTILIAFIIFISFAAINVFAEEVNKASIGQKIFAQAIENNEVIISNNEDDDFADIDEIIGNCEISDEEMSEVVGEGGTQLVTGITPGIMDNGGSAPYNPGFSATAGHYFSTSMYDAYYIDYDNDGDPYITYNTIRYFNLKYIYQHSKKNKK